MAKKLSVMKPGLLQRANRAKRELTQLYDALADTTGAHVTVSSDLATARSDVDTLITHITAL